MHTSSRVTPSRVRLARRPCKQHSGMGTPTSIFAILAAAVFCKSLSCVSGFFAPMAVSRPSRSFYARSRCLASTKELNSSGKGGETQVSEIEAEGAPSSSSALDRKKAELMRLILGTSIEQKESPGAADRVDSIIGELETLNQGFQEGSVDGEWVLCFTRNSEGSPSLQKVLPGDRGFQNFDVQAKQFSNIVTVWGGKLKIVANVAYEVRPEQPNRLVSTIVGAGVSIWRLRVPLPLTGRVGYLEFTYQDRDIRVSRGNRGGLFLHMRPGSAFPLDSED